MDLVEPEKQLLLILLRVFQQKDYKLNATDAKTEDIKQIIQSLHTLEGMNGIFLYLDEIQNFIKNNNKRY